MRRHRHLRLRRSLAPNGQRSALSLPLSVRRRPTVKMRLRAAKAADAASAADVVVAVAAVPTVSVRPAMNSPAFVLRTSLLRHGTTAATTPPTTLVRLTLATARALNKPLATRAAVAASDAASDVVAAVAARSTVRLHPPHPQWANPHHPNRNDPTIAAVDLLSPTSDHRNSLANPENLGTSASLGHRELRRPWYRW